jgi:hypothetical protein
MLADDFPGFVSLKTFGATIPADNDAFWTKHVDRIVANSGYKQLEQVINLRNCIRGTVFVRHDLTLSIATQEISSKIQHSMISNEANQHELNRRSGRVESTWIVTPADPGWQRSLLAT